MPEQRGTLRTVRPPPTDGSNPRIIAVGYAECPQRSFDESDCASRRAADGTFLDIGQWIRQSVSCIHSYDVERRRALASRQS